MNMLFEHMLFVIAASIITWLIAILFSKQKSKTLRYGALGFCCGPCYGIYSIIYSGGNHAIDSFAVAAFMGTMTGSPLGLVIASVFACIHSTLTYLQRDTIPLQ